MWCLMMFLFFPLIIYAGDVEIDMDALHHNVHELTDHIIDRYYHDHTDLTDAIKHHITSRLCQEKENSMRLRLHMLAQRKILAEKEDKRYMHDLIVQATKDAFKEQQDALDKKTQEADNKWSKKKAACCASITGITTTLITAGVTLAVNFAS